MKKCAVVYNPKSGKKRNNQEFLKTTKEILNCHNYEETFLKTTKSGDATRLISALEDDYDLVIVAGGDGTLNEGIAGNLMRKKRLLLGGLPIGTTNDVGSMYGYTTDYKKDLELLLNGTVQTVDVCYINSKPFIYVACLGNYVDVSYATPRKLKEILGRVGYILYGMKRVMQRLKKYHIEYEIDGKKLEDFVTFIFITNSDRVAGFTNFFHDVKLNDGMFEVVFCTAKKKRDLIKIIPSILTHQNRKIPGISYYKTNYLKIEFLDKRKESWCLDGEQFDTNKSSFEFCVKNELPMLVPVKNVEKLFEGETE